jgi:hypothetical protein
MSMRTGTDRTIDLLNRLLPGFVAQPITERTQRIDSTKIDLPLADGADYFFQLWTEPELQICAELAKPSCDVNYFWYRPFESAEFRDSTESLDTAFCETVEKLLVHETRIIQKNGWLNWHFRCEYKTADHWKRISSHSALRLGGWKTPKIDGRVHVYNSSALVHGA